MASVKIIRVQLPSDNKYYSSDEKIIYTEDDRKNFTRGKIENFSSPI